MTDNIVLHKLTGPTQSYVRTNFNDFKEFTVEQRISFVDLDGRLKKIIFEGQEK